MRAAIYARYSTDRQSPLSIDDQLRVTRALVSELGAHVVREFPEAEISGFSAARPQLNALLDLVRQGGVDLVVAEHSDRLARDGEKSWQIFNLFRSMGVRYVTVQEGDVSIVHQGVSTLVSELKGEEVRLRTRRGLQGVVEAGRSGGGLTYGYRVKMAYDARGERERGLLEVDDRQAEIVRRIFRDYAAGSSPLAIAIALNAEAAPGPRGGVWNASTIAGNATRANGILHNELYIGWRVWGRRTFVKDRTTGTRRGRAAPGEPVRQHVPELRIIDDDLWTATRARHAEVAHGPHRRGNGKRPKRFLQGLIVCGLCGGTMISAGPNSALRCSTRAYRKGCANTSAPGYAGIEARVVAAIRGNLLHPVAIERAIRVAQEVAREDRKDHGRRQAKLSAELAEVKRRASRILDQVAEGLVSGAAIRDKLGELEARREDLEAEISEAPAAEVAIMHPNAAAMWRRYVEQLASALDNPEDADAREDRAAVRALISEIRFTPTGRGQYDLEIAGDLAPILMLGNEKDPLAGAFGCVSSQRGVGAGTRITRTHRVRAPFRTAA